MYMRWLENDVEITPALKERSKAVKGLQLVYDNPNYHFAEPMRGRARALCEKWEGQNWGKGEVVEDESSDDDDPAITSGSEEPGSLTGKTPQVVGDDLIVEARFSGPRDAPFHHPPATTEPPHLRCARHHARTGFEAYRET